MWAQALNQGSWHDWIRSMRLLPNSYDRLFENAVHWKWWMKSHNLLFLCANLSADPPQTPPSQTRWQSKHGSNYKHYQDCCAVMSFPLHPQWSHMTNCNTLKTLIGKYGWRWVVCAGTHTRQETSTQIYISVEPFLYTHSQTHRSVWWCLCWVGKWKHLGPFKTYPYANNWKAWPWLFPFVHPEQMLSSRIYVKVKKVNNLHDFGNLFDRQSIDGLHEMWCISWMYSFKYDFTIDEQSIQVLSRARPFWAATSMYLDELVVDLVCVFVCV